MGAEMERRRVQVTLVTCIDMLDLRSLIRLIATFEPYILEFWALAKSSTSHRDTLFYFWVTAVHYRCYTGNNNPRPLVFAPSPSYMEPACTDLRLRCIRIRWPCLVRQCKTRLRAYDPQRARGPKANFNHFGYGILVPSTTRKEIEMVYPYCLFALHQRSETIKKP
jgi:hypothetical protein